ncbi:hypothetical protein GZH47_03305 [Paenibacillus rhizovicinus]|uniref:Uncharacterized protein n=1 Tax=Paenibacillus rhizovicinus TaxID=2704463 RepID=A0A6C0NVK7_9BACL|nr:hypothetical protein [Paenibacillus rhizovicinus]QHW29956.1 hypothetical protein GZH47_03305 [Paenibacillus rhizovicinus]
MLLYHYFERGAGPFRNLSALSDEDAACVSARLRVEGRAFASKRSDDYLAIRRELEQRARSMFVRKGGRPSGNFPHYMTLGPCRWLETWFVEPEVIALDWDYFTAETLSFTYGDLFPTMRVADGRPYREQVYTKAEIRGIIGQYGLPQHWNPEGESGPERYIEVQVWDDAAVQTYARQLIRERVNNSSME